MFLKSSKPKQISEAELLVEYKNSGNLTILGNLYEPLMDMVYAISYKYLKDDEASKDAVMAIFEQIIDDLKMHEIQNFRSWLHSVTRNHCLMLIRKNKEDIDEIIIEKFMENETDLHPLDDLTIDLQLNKLDSCLETLNQEQKICIKLFYLEDKSYREIAITTNYDEIKVKSYIQNGKRNLKNCIDKKNGF